MGNGFSCQEKLCSSKLPSVLEAIAGEYALVINGHSLVRAHGGNRTAHCMQIPVDAAPPWSRVDVKSCSHSI